MNKIGAVLPLCITGSYDVDDLGRTEILFKSLAAFMQPGLIDPFLIVTPPHEVDIVREKCGKWTELFNIQVLSEEDLVPEMKNHPHVRGWRKQQLVKLAAARVIKRDFFITFDADVICLRPLAYDDLIVNNKAILQYEARALHPKWWKSSSRILNMNPNVGDAQIGMSVTPALMSTELCQLAMAEIGGKKRNWADYLCSLHKPSNPKNWWIGRYLKNKWTEYSLYYLAAMKNNALDNHHIRCGTTELPQELLIHDSHPYAEWDVAKSFAPERNGLFCVVGSKTRLEPADVWQKIAKYIPYSN
ncbi:hypothetical protein C2869_10370 [Saccharobesus litoralis]|uniref:Uncharacterized protein n=1 Tax=Saccharobesus litoralis TaxID=2172099 RepID=A0A2S0VRG8_9ALTE|nr:DUF6492 family protein [Saccharobesus litoralis]AWB66808.1 hypothetical protein C2869_10370 [Saccharobesus litoralis]